MLLGQEAEVDQPVGTGLPDFRFVLLVKDEILVLNAVLLHLKWLLGDPDVPFSPLEFASEVAPLAQLGRLSRDAEVLAELGLEVYLERQQVVIRDACDGAGHVRVGY